MIPLGAPLVALALAAGPPPAPAPDPVRYTGAFRAVEAHVGLRLRDGGPAGGLALRAATVLSLVDLDLDWRATDPGRGAVHDLAVGARLHPFALLLFHEAAWADALASVFVRVGLGARLAHRLGGVWQLGVGLDLPLGDPDRGAGWWIGPRYRHSLPIGPVVGVEAQGGGAVGLALAYRFNGL